MIKKTKYVFKFELFRSNLTLPVHQVQENHQDVHHIQEINDNYSMMLSIHVLKNLIKFKF
jgi:hypothetical protein